MTQFFGHPRGLATLFFTELWERFSYYGMRALLILFMTAAVDKGGLGFDVAKAGAIYGLYTSSAYLMNLPGGWLADRFLGQRRAVLYGGIVIALGHYCLALPSLAAFYGGLALVVCGTGLLKPNISTMVGQLYTSGDPRRDAGFSIFYMGINLGAFVAPLLCGWLGQRVNWHAGFGLAGIGMTLGVIQYALGGRHLGDAGLRPAPTVAEGRSLKFGLLAVGALSLAGCGLVGAGFISISASGLADAFGLLLFAIVAGVFGWLFFGGQWTVVERKRLFVIGALFIASALFWSAFEQAGSSLNLFAERSTRTSVLGFEFPASWLQSVNAMFIITLAPVFAWIWIRMGSKDPSSPAKFALGLISVGVGFAILAGGAVAAASGQMVSPMWLVATYLFHTIGELCLSPVGLSAMTKLAPPSVGGLLMGVWFVSLSVGNYLGGRVASLYESFPLPMIFAVVAGFAIGSGLILAVFVRPIVRLMGGVR